MALEHGVQVVTALVTAVKRAIGSYAVDVASSGSGRGLNLCEYLHAVLNVVETDKLEYFERLGVPCLLRELGRLCGELGSV